MQITICLGDSCHLKGTRPVAEQLQKLIAENGLKDEIDLAGTFCMGRCSPLQSSSASYRTATDATCCPPLSILHLLSAYFISSRKAGNCGLCPPA